MCPFPFWVSIFDPQPFKAFQTRSCDWLAPSLMPRIKQWKEFRLSIVQSSVVWAFVLYPIIIQALLKAHAHLVW